MYGSARRRLPWLAQLKGRSMSPTPPRVAIEDSVKLACFDAIFIDWLGGPEVYEMVLIHFNGTSIRDLADMFDLPAATAWRRIATAHEKLHRVGLSVPVSRTRPRRK